MNHLKIVFDKYNSIKHPGPDSQLLFVPSTCLGKQARALLCKLLVNDNVSIPDISKFSTLPMHLLASPVRHKLYNDIPWRSGISWGCFTKSMCAIIVVQRYVHSYAQAISSGILVCLLAIRRKFVNLGASSCDI